jgi:cytoskeletal protein CcmA (bactofilin family)
MFNSKSNSQHVDSSIGAASLISTGTTLTGDVNTNADLRIDGTLIGNIVSSAKIILGTNGVIEGNISGQQADILGKVKGTIKVTDLLQLKGNGSIHGNIHAGKLQIEPSANFNGSCHMNTGNATEDTVVEESKVDKTNGKKTIAA